MKILFVKFITIAHGTNSYHNQLTGIKECLRRYSDGHIVFEGFMATFGTSNPILIVS